jgi:hypothetical protein
MKVTKIAPLFFCAAALYGAGTLDIYFVDVEIGNAVLMVTPSGQTLMMDAGSHLPNNRDRDRVMAAIKKAGVTKIDYMVATHYHNDHYGAIADLAPLIPITNFVDHGPFVQYHKGPEWYKMWFALWPHNAVEAPYMDQQFDEYRKVTEQGNHIVVDAGDKLPLKGLDVTVVTSAGNHLIRPLPGAGKPNPACMSTEIRSADPSEDGQSVGLVISYGKFRFINLGDLTWNKSYELFCPNDPIGRVDLYMVTHHGMSDPKETGDIDWGRSCCTPAEMHALSPRVAVESCGPTYHKGSSPMGWQAVHGTPSVEDIWQTNYHPQGGKENNSAERFIANPPRTPASPAYNIHVSVEPDGTYTVTNERNQYSKSYEAGK